ncbi:MAG: hypothetical protein M1815_003179 [Lichina confinis]|nr:MAG: hypothetical protein M1815_003179 [Lichina confinis]
MSHVAAGLAPDVPAREDFLPEEEPYTIRCICGFDDDDGSTVFCERCETWQHIDCYYYPARKVPDVHICVDCEPRPLDGKRALERQQRRRREQENGPERKVRRPLGKVAKRKPRDAGAAVAAHANAFPTSTKAPSTVAAAAAAAATSTTAVPVPSDRRNGLIRDQPPPAKKHKTTHRNSNSIASQSDLKRGPSATLGAETLYAQVVVPALASAISPPESNSDAYSPHLGQRPEYFGVDEGKRVDRDASPLRANVLHDISLIDSMSSWIHDADALAQVAPGRTPAEVFQRFDGAFESLQAPELARRANDAPRLDGPDHDGGAAAATVAWPYLTVESAVPAGGLVGELKGEIGDSREYYRNACDRGLTLHHPERFVFLHPHLPIYIDTRRDGTRCRYVRRSCRPNIQMSTLISDGTDYHFCFCATEHLDPGKEITLRWDHDGAMKALLDQATRQTVAASTLVKPEMLTAREQEDVERYLESILATQGGCACEETGRCTLAPLDRWRARATFDTAHPWPDGARHRKVRSGRSRRTPPGGGAAGASRSGSELRVPRENEEDNPHQQHHPHPHHHHHHQHNDESRSTSGSFPSKPQSRDITPLTHVSTDPPLATPGSELSDREKRKIAAVERTFEQLEQQEQHQHQGPRRRKRNNSQVVPPGGAMVMAASTAAATTTVRSPEMGPQKPPGFRSASTSQPTTPLATVKTEQAEPIPPAGPEGDSTADGELGPPATLAPIAPSPTEQPPQPSSYVSSETQTDAIGRYWYQEAVMRSARRGFWSLSRRLLVRCHNRRAQFNTLRDGRRSVDRDAEFSSTPTASVNVPSDDVLDKAHPSMPSPSHLPEGVPPEDEPRIDDGSSKPSDPVSLTHSSKPDPEPPRPPDVPVTPTAISTEVKVAPLDPPPPLPPPPLAAQALTGVRVDSSNHGSDPRSAGLRVQLPPTPNFGCPSPSTGSSMAASVGQSPQTHTHTPVLFSPSGSLTQASPIKKKLSLSDYVSRRKEAEGPHNDRGSISATSAPASALPAKMTPSPLSGDARVPEAATEQPGTVEPPARQVESSAAASSSTDVGGTPWQQK